MSEPTARDGAGGLSPPADWRTATDATGAVGDEVAVASHRVRGGRRSGRIEEVLGTPGHPYYRVRWDDGRDSILHPGPDTQILVRNAPASTRPARRTAPAAKGEPRRSTERRQAPERPRERLRAAPGDRLVIGGHRLGERDRDAEVLETAEHGLPPFRVRWSDTGRVALLFPGSDARVEHFPRRRSRKR